MFPNKNVNISQFYPVHASPAYSHHSYPYSLYIQPNHAMGIVPQTPTKNTPPPYLDESFANGSSFSGLGANNGETMSFNQEFYQKENTEGSNSKVISLPKYFRCTLGKGLTRYRRERTVFTQNQLSVLEKRFEAQKYLSTQERYELARKLGLSPLQVKTWFQNRRMKWKKTALKDQQSQSMKANETLAGEENQLLNINTHVNDHELSFE